jgi:hypothetical protein
MSTVISPMPASSRGQCESWLLVFNCQVLGLGNSLNLLSDEIHVEHYDPAAFRKNVDDILDRWDSFERVLIAPKLESLLPDELRSADKVWKIPTISFNAYHPDICYLLQGGKTFKGPMGDYHSIIAYAAYRMGLSIDQAVQLYNEHTYSQLGYFDRWDSAKQLLLDSFDRGGISLGPQFANWSRNGAFMYSNNHVQVRCLLDVAKEILRRAGKTIAFEGIAPHDNLLNGPIFPIYPEIGSRLGVQGSYLFKLGGQYRFIRLERFVSDSFELYAQHPDLSAIPDQSTIIERAQDVIGRRA